MSSDAKLSQENIIKLIIGKLSCKDSIVTLIGYLLDAATIEPKEKNVKTKILNTKDIIIQLAKLVGFKKLIKCFIFFSIIKVNGKTIKNPYFSDSFISKKRKRLKTASRAKKYHKYIGNKKRYHRKNNVSLKDDISPKDKSDKQNSDSLHKLELNNNDEFNIDINCDDADSSKKEFCCDEKEE